MTPTAPPRKQMPCGPAGLAWLDKSPAFRNGRAMVREALATDLHASGMTRAADQEYQRAKDIREGRE